MATSTPNPTGEKKPQTEPDQRIWWGPETIPEGATLRWRIGPMTLWIQRTLYELRIGRNTTNDPFDSALENVTLAEPEELEASGTLDRFALFDSMDDINLSPALADRPLVTRPQSPFHILPADEVQLFVSSPLWVRIELGPARQVLREFPIYRPPDTWFGPSTLTGELCYASRTHCRLKFDDVPIRPHRAVTPVLIRNLYNTPLRVERLSVPVPHLSIFSGSSGHLWTQAITITRKEEKDGLAQVELEKGPPAESPDAQLINSPRQEPKNNLLFRAFSGIF